MRNFKYLICLVLFGALSMNASLATASDPFDPEELKLKLKTDGLDGWIHGSFPEMSQYVFTYRDPENFFVFENFSVFARNPAIKEQLAKLGRHDRILLKGRLIDQGTPQKHIFVTSLEVLETFDSGHEMPDYKHMADVPVELEDKSQLVGKVHAIAHGGKVLVIEYKDVVLPVVVNDSSFTKDLFRNDKIILNYQIQKHPTRPTHLVLDEEVETPIEVTQAIVEEHEQQLSLEGKIVLFPKSPQLKFDVFALQIEDSNGIKTNYTLVNFKDFEVFFAILDKLGNWWKEYEAFAINGRNKLIIPKLIIRATGIGNVVDAGQANPQILLDSINSIEIVSRPEGEDLKPSSLPLR